MVLLYPLYTKNVADIWRMIQHYLQKSRTHLKDKKFFDPDEERSAFEEIEGLVKLVGVTSLKEFRRILREAMRQQYDQRAMRKPVAASSAKTNSKKPKKTKPPRVGYHFIWPPPDSWQSLFWAFSPSKRRILSRDLQNLLDSDLNERFGDAPRIVTVHTDTPRIHAEAAISKYLNGKKLKGFKGINSFGDSDASRRGMLAGLKEKTLPEDAISWIELTSCKLTKALKEKTFLLYRSLDEDAQAEFIGKAMKVYEWLSIIQTDETLAGKEDCPKPLGTTSINPDRPIRAIAHEEITHWLGKNISMGISPDPEWMAHVQKRVAEVKERRDSEKQIAGPKLSTRRTRGRDRQQRSVRKKKRDQKLQDEMEKAQSEASKLGPVVSKDDSKQVEGCLAINMQPDDLSPTHYDFIQLRVCHEASKDTIPLDQKETFDRWRSRQPDVRLFSRTAEIDIEKIAREMLRVFRHELTLGILEESSPRVEPSNSPMEEELDNEHSREERYRPTPKGREM